MVRVAEAGVEYSYLRKVDELRRERELLANVDNVGRGISY